MIPNGKNSVAVSVGPDDRYCLSPSLIEILCCILGLTGRSNPWNKIRGIHPGHENIVPDSNKT